MTSKDAKKSWKFFSKSLSAVEEEEARHLFDKSGEYFFTLFHESVW